MSEFDVRRCRSTDEAADVRRSILVNLLGQLSRQLGFHQGIVEGIRMNADILKADIEGGRSDDDTVNRWRAYLEAVKVRS